MIGLELLQVQSGAHLIGARRLPIKTPPSRCPFWSARTLGQRADRIAFSDRPGIVVLLPPARGDAAGVAEVGQTNMTIEGAAFGRDDQATEEHVASSRLGNAAREIVNWATNLRGPVALAAALIVGACAGTNPTGPRTSTQPEVSAIPNEITGSFESVTYGDPSPRVRALRAFATGSGAVRLRMVRTTIEGDPITYYLIVDGRSVRLFVDWRQDRFGGGRAVTEERVTDLWLVRMNSGDQPLTRVDPERPLPAGVYALHGLVCPTESSCLREF